MTMTKPARLHLLVVDDTEEDRRLILQLTAAFPVAANIPPPLIHEAETGAAALTYCRQLVAQAELLPHFILLDLNLPDCSGLDVLKELAQNPALSQIPVIILTGATTKRLAEAVATHGARHLLIKEELSSAKLQQFITEYGPAHFTACGLQRDLHEPTGMSEILSPRLLPTRSGELATAEPCLGPYSPYGPIRAVVVDPVPIRAAVTVKCLRELGIASEYFSELSHWQAVYPLSSNNQHERRIPWQMALVDVQLLATPNPSFGDWQQHTPNFLFIGTTANLVFTDTYRWLQAGCNAVLRRPIDPKKLTELIDLFLRLRA